MLETLTKANDKLEEIIDNIDMNHPNLDEGILIIGNEISPVLNHIKNMAPDEALMEINSIGMGPEIRRAEFLMIQFNAIIDKIMDTAILLEELKKGNKLLNDAISKIDIENPDLCLVDAIVIYYVSNIVCKLITMDPCKIHENDMLEIHNEIEKCELLLGQMRGLKQLESD